MKIISKTALVIGLGLFAAQTPSILMAQSDTDEAAEAAMPAEEAPAFVPVGTDLGANLIQQLASEEEQSVTAMADITARIAQLSSDTENADAIFDEMAAAIERQAALGDPEGQFILEVERLTDQARQLEIDARELGDDEIATRMSGVVASLDVVRTEALSLHSDSFRALREIKAQKSKFVLRLQANFLESAVEVAREGVANLASFNERINEIKDTIQPDDEAGTVEE